MTYAYQNFLDFFTTANKDRLDGLNETHFNGMSPEERSKAFDYLLKRVLNGGSRESVGGLFVADPARAASIARQLLNSGKLREDAEISAAWELYQIQPDSSLIPVFTKLMSSANETNRSNAAFYVPANVLTPELDAALKGMIRTETETLPLVNAINKLLECHGITRESVSKEEFSKFYLGLRSDVLADKEKIFKQLDSLTS
ncbi:hypothetical protein GCM10025794_01740 [Massilia kyonggiensis]|jgi:hypothetical protein|nr:hypothetical protein [Massilia kyonggiensis]